MRNPPTAKLFNGRGIQLAYDNSRFRVRCCRRRSAVVKLIIAMIQADKLQAIQEALNEPDAYIMYVSSVGDIREPVLGSYRGTAYEEPRPRLRLEIVVVNDLMVQDAIEVITRVACTPNLERISNGGIFVMPLDEWIRMPADRPRSVPNAQETPHSAREAS